MSLTNIQKHIYYLTEGENDPFNKINNLTSSGVTKFQLIAAGVFTLVLVITGVIYGVGGAELKKKMKEHWLAIAVAVLIVYGGAMAITWFIAFVQTSQ